MKLVPLKEFCKMYQPPTISTKEMIPDGEFVVYGANGPIGRYDKFNHEEPQLLVTCRGATCGAVNMSEPFAWINGNAMVIQPDLKLATLEYMKYAFLGGIDISSSITGSAQPQITRTRLEVIKVALPSVEKQKEIVEKLDSAFAEIDLLIEESESKRRLLRQIYDQEVESVFYRNINGWPSTTIDESCDYKNGKAHEQLVDPAGKYRLVTSKFVSSNGKLARRVTTALTPLVSGDVAFVLSDLPNGKALAKAYLVEAEKDLTLNQRVLRVRSSKFIPKFLYLQINRHPYLLSFDNGESQTHLKLAQALSCPLLIPDLEIQKQTSERLIGLRSEVEHYEEILNRKLLMLNTLRQSLLFQAFDYSETAGLVA
jgi:type I restriction enzyme S subunit